MKLMTYQKWIGRFFVLKQQQLRANGAKLFLKGNMQQRLLIEVILFNFVMDLQGEDRTHLTHPNQLKKI